MNATQYAYLLNNPESVNTSHVAVLDNITEQFPFFQSARAIQLKNLFVQDSFQYNQSLRRTAAFTTDRTVLFEFITSKNFSSIQKLFFTEREEAKIQVITLNELEIISEESIQEAKQDAKTIIGNIDNTMPYQAEKLANSIRDLVGENKSESYTKSEFIASSQPVESEKRQAENRLDIGKPFFFTTNEKHSFQEWLQLTNLKPIERNILYEKKDIEIVQDDEVKQKKMDIIDRFIASNPKISSVKNYIQSVTPTIENDDNPSIMTETLAKVYLEQKKYQKAIQAYEILILKYPEKITFFADRISDIKSLQQINH